MPENLDWIKILIDCKNHVLKNISPLLKIRNQRQKYLGIGAGGDPIKTVDLIAENAIVAVLKRRGIKFTLISEESGIVEQGTSRDCFVTTDPIDGTTNLTRGAPFYATSIAVSSEPTLSAIYAGLVGDLVHKITYTAARGKGAHRNGVSIKPSSNASVEEGVMGIDLNSYKIKTLVPRLTALMSMTAHLRHFGANALELCYVADGTTDAFVDIRGKLRTTDIAAAYLIVTEAGGILKTPKGKRLEAILDPKQRVEFLAAGNKELFTRIMRLINS